MFSEALDHYWRRFILIIVYPIPKTDFLVQLEVQPDEQNPSPSYTKKLFFANNKGGHSDDFGVTPSLLKTFSGDKFI